jgi:uncharacterized protein (DUF2344 family)
LNKNLEKEVKLQAVQSHKDLEKLHKRISDPGSLRSSKVSIYEEPKVFNVEYQSKISTLKPQDQEQSQKPIPVPILPEETINIENPNNKPLSNEQSYTIPLIYKQVQETQKKYRIITPSMSEEVYAKLLASNSKASGSEKNMSMSRSMSATLKPQKPSYQELLAKHHGYIAPRKK